MSYSILYMIIGRGDNLGDLMPGKWKKDDLRSARAARARGLSSLRPTGSAAGEQADRHIQCVQQHCG